MMSSVDKAWGQGPSTRYGALAAGFRPIFARIAAGAVEREQGRHLPWTEIAWLKETGLTTLRVPREAGGLGASLPELFSLLVELSAADPNVTNALRSHFGFTEDVLNASDATWRDLWIGRIAAGQTIGSGFSETGDAKAASYSTTLSRSDDGWRVNGEKFYTTGSLFADWINLGARNEAGDPVGAVVDRHAPGVEVLDDWDGFGQALTASGTARFADVALPADAVNPFGSRFRYSSAFFQLVHLATLAGIARAAATDVARLVADRRRIYSHGNAPRVSADPQILQVVGRVRGQAYSAGAIVLQVAQALEHAYQAQQNGDDAAALEAAATAELEVNQAVTVVSSLVLEATTVLFDALGASAARKSHGLDRHWRNARTITSHNPRIYRERILGDYAVNGALPAGQYRVGTA